MLLLTTLLMGGCKSDHQHKSATVDYTVSANYLILPIEERGRESRMTVVYPDGKEEQLVVRLAEQSIDYHVKLDLRAYMGKRVKIRFEGVDKHSLGVKEITQSDKFEFEYNEPYRPAFHFTPEYGWMNDPNGMVYYEGEYHLFFQYNPYGNRWQNMHWGHAVSTDLVSWTYLPTPLAPDTLGAIFSGSAVIDKNNTAGFGENAMIAIYTSAGRQQSQSIAYSLDKGRTFTKYEGNPVIPNPGIVDFRDPKVMWHEGSAQWIMSLATRQTITFYGSPDLKQWTRLSEFGNGIGAHGGVWECPDLIPLTLDGKEKWVLLVSINPGGVNHGSATQYFIGDFDGKQFVADPLPYPIWLDHGRDNYAGVTWSNIPETDGRTILIGWMSNWDYATEVPSHLFRSAMTIPRELTLGHNGKHPILLNYPIKEVEKLRGKTTVLSDQVVTPTSQFEHKLSDDKGTFEIVMTVRPDKAKHFGFVISNNEGDQVRYVFDLVQNSLMVDRKASGNIDFHPQFPSISYSHIRKADVYQVRLLVDKSSSEIFLNGGEAVLTNLHFPRSNYNKLTFFSDDQSWRATGISVFELN